MLLTDFDYELPEELIAQEPSSCRDGSRMMVLNRANQQVSCTDFKSIINYFRPGDVLVCNDTEVIPARLLGRKVTGGKVEIFLVRREAGCDDETWLCLTKSSKSIRSGTVVHISDGLMAEVLEEAEAPYRRVRFDCAGDFLEHVDKIGHLPLPPYIRRPDDPADRERYQTVFAREKGAVAAPTAGLHFTPEILARLQEAGVILAPLTLHVGLGTFLPVRVENVLEHKMHTEIYQVPEQTATLINQAHAQGNRVIALGTTSARALETAATQPGVIKSGSGESDIFIYPGYQFKIVDGLITNFHLPKSTLLMLVSALAGKEFILSAYHRAVKERFRFFSYGDCMLIQ